MIFSLISQNARKRMVLLSVLVNRGSRKSLEESESFGKLDLNSKVSEVPQWKFK